jgi:hypothetical protein
MGLCCVSNLDQAQRRRPVTWLAAYALRSPGRPLLRAFVGLLTSFPLVPSWGTKDKEHAMLQKLNNEIAVIGIDIGKNSFHIVGQDQRGAIVLRQEWSRGQVESRLANLLPCLIGMEACVGAQLGCRLIDPDAFEGTPVVENRQAPARGAPVHPQAGTKEQPQGANKGTA